MKSVSEVQAELTLMEQALRDCAQLMSQRGARSYRVQSVTAAVVLGTASKADLARAQSELDESVEAVIRKGHLELSVASLQSQLESAKGTERRQTCEAVAAEHSALYEKYKADSKALLAVYKQLQHLNHTYLGLTSRELHGGHEHELNLPAISGALLHSTGFTTGQEP